MIKAHVTAYVEKSTDCRCIADNLMLSIEVENPTPPRFLHQVFRFTIMTKIIHRKAEF